MDNNFSVQNPSKEHMSFTDGYESLSECRDDNRLKIPCSYANVDAEIFVCLRKILEATVWFLLPELAIEDIDRVTNALMANDCKAKGYLLKPLVYLNPLGVVEEAIELVGRLLLLCGQFAQTREASMDTYQQNVEHLAWNISCAVVRCCAALFPTSVSASDLTLIAMAVLSGNRDQLLDEWAPHIYGDTDMRRFHKLGIALCALQDLATLMRVTDEIYEMDRLLISTTAEKSLPSTAALRAVPYEQEDYLRSSRC